MVFDVATDGESTDVIGGRWWHKDCATFAATKANPNRVMYPRYSNCLRCGKSITDHGFWDGDAWCDWDIPWVHPTRADHADRRVALEAAA